jgi:hypothetical protein
LPKTERPIGDLLIGSHANERGVLSLDLAFWGIAETGLIIRSASVSYEWLEDAGTKLNISPDVLKDSQGNVVTRCVRIFGCQIGSAEPLMNKLKAAFGGLMQVRAPRFYDCLSRNYKGALEYLEYGFEVTSLDKLEGVALVDAFTKAGHKYYDNESAVPEGRWTEWIKGAPSQPIINLVPPVEGKPTDPQALVVLWRFENDHTTFDFPLKLDGAPKGRDKKGRIERQNYVKKNFTEDPDLAPLFDKNKHEYPIFKRERENGKYFESMEKYVEGFDWWREESGKWRGHRCLYICRVPIVKIPTDSNEKPIYTKEAKNELLYNYWPKQGIGIHLGLDENDSNLFTTV